MEAAVAYIQEDLAPSQPVTWQSQPVDLLTKSTMQLESVVMQSQPMVTQSVTEGMQSEPMAMQSEPEGMQSEPMVMLSEPVVMQLQPMIMQSAPEFMQSQPMVVQSDPVDMESQPVSMQLQSEMIESEPVVSIQLQLKESQPVKLESQQAAMQSQAVTMQSQEMGLHLQSMVTPTTPYTNFQHWDEKPSAVFMCRLCKKTFYNANALQNHRKMQHDGEASCSENEYPAFHDDQDWYNFLGRGAGFRFIPCDTDCSTDTVTDGLTTRVYSEDTTYIIVKVDSDDGDIRLQGARKVSPVELRGPFTCTFPTPLGPELQCRQIFFNCCDYSLHYREEHTKRRKAALRCQVCEKRLDRDFNPTVSLAAQLQAANQITFSCRMCGQTFLDSSQYDDHNRIVHAKMKPHQCPLCTKRFTQQGGLQQHLRMHSGIRPFACTFCPKAFTQKAGLDQHLRTHTKVKPFICVICNKSFSQSVHLRQHMRTHTNIQPFECSVCRRRFKQSSHLNFHMRCHVNEGTLAMETYTQAIQQQNRLDFLNLANLQPVQDGETLYYAAEIAPSMHPNHNTFGY